ncbi:hypothetical protein HDV06_000770 [Boothiomyces sp. JEL0866]|nr:hypothetical protein HDV06_000770 [Boothiomyces sp. JEL0866]
MKSIKLSPIDNIPKSKSFSAQGNLEGTLASKNTSDSGLDKSNKIILEPLLVKSDISASTSGSIQKNDREGSLSTESGTFSRHGLLSSLQAVDKSPAIVLGSEEMLNQRNAEVERSSDVVAANIDNTIFKSEEMLNHRRATVQRINAPNIEEPNEFPIYPELTRIDIRALVDTMEPIITNPRRAYTPLIVDPSHRVDIFFEYSADYSGVFIDAKKYMVEAFVKKSKTINQCLLEMKEILLNAMKCGKTLVFHMGDSATNFVTKFNHPDIFPSLDILAEAGRKMKLEENYRKLTDDPQFVCRNEFCVVVTSGFQVEDYREFLCHSLPLDEMVAIYIMPPTSAPKAFAP